VQFRHFGVMIDFLLLPLAENVNGLFEELLLPTRDPGGGDAVRWSGN